MFVHNKTHRILYFQWSSLAYISSTLPVNYNGLSICDLCRAHKPDYLITGYYQSSHQMLRCGDLWSCSTFERDFFSVNEIKERNNCGRLNGELFIHSLEISQRF